MKKPLIFWSVTHGKWLATGVYGRNIPAGNAKDAAAFCKKLNYYKGPENRQARLLSAWASQGTDK